MVLQFANIPLRRRRKQLINKGIINMDVLMKALSFVGKKCEMSASCSVNGRDSHDGNITVTGIRRLNVFSSTLLVFSVVANTKRTRDLHG